MISNVGDIFIFSFESGPQPKTYINNILLLSIDVYNNCEYFYMLSCVEDNRNTATSVKLVSITNFEKIVKEYQRC